MRGGRLSGIVAAVVGIAIVLAVTALIGNRDDSSETVPTAMRP